jgi:SAM-dependent methyltransferase
MKLYGSLAGWWPMFSSPRDYLEEARLFTRILSSEGTPMKNLLELGSGGGNNAFHMKKDFKMTLADLSAGMLRVSRRLNSDCEHVEGDMRTIRLGRTFDGVFMHDAIMYIKTLKDLKMALKTAYVHCRPNGVVLAVPDAFKETFIPKTSHGGHDSGGRGLRYLMWSYDPDPKDNTFVTEFAFMLRDPGGRIRHIHERHVMGLFAKKAWLAAMSEAGFQAQIVPLPHSELPKGSYNAIVGIK